MKIRTSSRRTKVSARSAFSMIEVLIASGVAALMFMIGMTAFSSTFRIVEGNRENSRAMQVLLEKTEVLRLYNWDQITGVDTNTYIPTTFTAPFCPGTTNTGFTYLGTVLITNVPITETYSNDMREIVVTVTWTSASSGNILRTRSMTTFVSRYGLQNYLY